MHGSSTGIVNRLCLALAAPLALAVLATTARAAIIPTTEIMPFDPNTYFAGGVTAGIDFDLDSSGDPGAQYVTQAGFLSVGNLAAHGANAYEGTTNGLTFHIDVTNANLRNQNRWRNSPTAGDIMNDFVQWYGKVANSPVEATVTLTGLVANTDYDVSFFTYNVGANQTTHSFYEGTSSAGTFITTFKTSGGNSNYSTWKPGVTFRINSGSNSTIAVTIQATQSSTDWSSRLTLDGIAVVQGATIPEPASLALLAIGGLLITKRRRA